MYDLFISGQRSENTKKAYQNDLNRWRDWLDGRVPTMALAIEWRDSLEAELKATSALRAFNTVRSYYKWAGIVPSPFDKVKAPRRVTDWVPVIPAEHDVDATLNVCNSPRDYGIISLLNNGLRAQEVVDLRSADFYYEEAYDAWVLRVTGKGNKMRMVPASDETTRALHKYAPTKADRMFLNINIRKVYGIVKKWSSLAGVDLHPHALRHCYATRLLRAGVDIISLQRLLGHTRADTTAIYTQLDLGDLVRASRKDPRNERVERGLRVVV